MPFTVTPRTAPPAPPPADVSLQSPAPSASRSVVQQGVQPKIRHQGVPPAPAPSPPASPSSASTSDNARRVSDRFKTYLTTGHQTLDGLSSAPLSFQAADASFQKGQYIAGLSSTFNGIDQLATATQGALGFAGQLATDANQPALAKGAQDLSTRIGTVQKSVRAFAQPLDATRKFLETFNDPSATQEQKTQSLLNVVSTGMRRGGDAALALNKAIGADSKFVERLGNDLKDAGSLGNFGAGLVQGIDDFGAAHRDSNVRGMLKAGTAVIANGVGAGQAAANVLARGFKDAGLDEAARFFERRRQDFADIKTVADGLQSETGLALQLFS